jgi:peptide/nickel transport system permease protein
VFNDVLRFFAATLELSTVAIVLGASVGVPSGVWAAVSRGRLADHAIRVVALIGYSVPVFWLGLVALLVFYSKLGWVGGPGRIDFFYNGAVESRTNLILVDTALAGRWDIFRNAIGHMALPVILLALYAFAYCARMTRSFMLDQLNQEYVTTARVKGLSETTVIWRHVFRNILVPLITVLALAYAHMLEGAVLTETVFAWPGIGLYVTSSLFNADMNAVLGGALMIGAVFVTLNLLADRLYRFADPRVQ